jgi:hypothetical protein
MGSEQLNQRWWILRGNDEDMCQKGEICVQIIAPQVQILEYDLKRGLGCPKMIGATNMTWGDQSASRESLYLQ